MNDVGFLSLQYMKFRLLFLCNLWNLLTLHRVYNIHIHLDMLLQDQNKRKVLYKNLINYPNSVRLHNTLHRLYNMHKHILNDLYQDNSFRYIPSLRLRDITYNKNRSTSRHSLHYHLYSWKWYYRNRKGSQKTVKIQGIIIFQRLISFVIYKNY